MCHGCVIVSLVIRLDQNNNKNNNITSIPSIALAQDMEPCVSTTISQPEVVSSPESVSADVGVSAVESTAGMTSPTSILSIALAQDMEPSGSTTISQPEVVCSPESVSVDVGVSAVESTAGMTYSISPMNNPITTATPGTTTPSSPESPGLSSRMLYSDAEPPLPIYDTVDGVSTLRPPPDYTTLVKGLNIMEANLNYQKIYNLLQNDKISELEKRILTLEGELIQTKAQFSVRDHVVQALRGEVNRLQQFTRRYTVSVSGIPKEKEEKDNPDILRNKVLKLVADVKSSTTNEDIDKFHRNGPVINRNEQEILIRFKSHAAKEAFYRARKNLPKSEEVRIRPSLSRHQSDLLRDAKLLVEEYSLNEEVENSYVNPVEFVFANIHGDIQAKLKHKFRKSHFISFHSTQDLACKLQEVQAEAEAKVVNQDEATYDEIYSWADNSRTPPPRQSNDDDDDMGFGLFT